VEAPGVAAADACCERCCSSVFCTPAKRTRPGLPPVFLVPARASSGRSIGDSGMGSCVAGCSTSDAACSSDERVASSVTGGSMHAGDAGAALLLQPLLSCRGGGSCCFCHCRCARCPTQPTAAAAAADVLIQPVMPPVLLHMLALLLMLAPHAPTMAVSLQPLLAPSRTLRRPCATLCAVLSSSGWLS
jgi:hypothetical protein